MLFINMSSLIGGLVFLLLLSPHRCIARPLRFMGHNELMENDVLGHVMESRASPELFAERGQETTRGKKREMRRMRRQRGRGMTGTKGEKSGREWGRKEREEDSVEMDYAQPHRKPPIHHLRL